jgi:hypothetical protein
MTPHWPSLHVAWAPGGAMQGALQAPQCLTLVSRSAHSLPQAVAPAAQSTVHLPSEHSSPAAHFLPQAPQFEALVVKSVQLPPQLA